MSENGEPSNSSADASAFSFLSSHTPDPGGHDQSIPTSGFSFLSTSTGDESEGDSTSSSGFNFLTGVSTASDAVVDAHQSSFSFLTASGVAPSTFVDDVSMLGPVIASQPQEIKLAKVAQAKVVKKKKKQSRVGVGRDDDPEDDEQTTPPNPPTPSVPAPSVPIEDPPAPAPALATNTASIADNSSQSSNSALEMKQIVSEPAQRIADLARHPSTPAALTSNPIPVPTPVADVSPKRSFFGSIFGGSSAKAAAPTPGPVPVQSSSSPAFTTSPIIRTAPATSETPTIKSIAEDSRRPSIDYVSKGRTTSIDVSSEASRRPSLPPAEPSSPPPSYVPELPPEEEEEADADVTLDEPVVRGASVAYQREPSPAPPAYSAPAPPSALAPVPSTKPAEPSIAKTPINTSTASELAAPTPVITKLAVKKKETVSERLQREAAEVFAVFATLSHQIAQDHRTDTASLRGTRQRIELCERDIRHSRQRLAEQEAEQHRLAQLEEFDRADALTDSVESLRSAVIEHTAALRSLTVIERDLEMRIDGRMKAQESALSDTQEKLESIRKQQDLELEILKSDADRRQANEESRLRNEEDRIALEKKHIDRDEEALNEEALVTEAKIASQSGDMNARRDETSEQLKFISLEIEELEQQLRKKQAEQQRLRAEYDDIDSRINVVRLKYDRQLQRVHDRRAVINHNKSECLQEEAALITERLALETDISSSQELRSGLRLWVGALDSDLAVADLVKMSVSHSQLLAHSAASGIDGDLKEAESAADQAVQAALTGQAEAAARLDLLHTEAQSLDDLLPKLEADKKAHASSKRFKEAAAVAKDVTALKSRKEELDAAISAATSVSAEKAELVAASLLVQEQASAAVRAAREVASVNRFADLRVRISQLRKVKKTIFRELSASGKKEFVGSSDFRESAVRLVEAELEGLVTEASDIQSEFAIRDSIDDDGDDSVGDNEGDEASTAADELDQVSAEEAANTATTNTHMSTINAAAPPALGPAPEGEERHFLMLEAKEVLAEVEQLNALLSTATEEEDYEAAAELDEQLTAKQTNLEQLVETLQCTRDDVAKYGDESDSNEIASADAAVDATSTEVLTSCDSAQSGGGSELQVCDASPHKVGEVAECDSEVMGENQEQEEQDAES